MASTLILVIGCGNPLRGDDGLGRAAAEQIASWQLPDVQVLSIHQLMPELIEEMKQAPQVLFIDAEVGSSDAPFRFCRLDPRKSPRIFGHYETPESLLTLLAELHEHRPTAHLMTIRGDAFGHGDALSEVARNRLEEAVTHLRCILSDKNVN
jgi:hydrogenase maturation protease